MKQFQEIVQTLLKRSPELRDNDQRLVANIWWQTISIEMRHRFLDYEIDAFKMLLKLYSDGDLPNEQTIRRIRRKLQEENEELRGKVYDQRHEKETEIIDTIRQFDRGEMFDE